MSDTPSNNKSAQESLESLRIEAESRISAAGSSADLAQIETEYLGRKGNVTGLLRLTGQLPPDERPGFGQRANELRQQLESLLAQKCKAIESSELKARLQEEAVDVTLPGRFYQLGRRHPVSSTIARVKDIFIGMGFQVVEGPEAEDYRYNFEVLNYPEDHPAMDAQMSFYVTDDILLRTQMTALQGRTFETTEPPMRMCSVGKTFRNDAADATHSHTFHQVDCFALDRGISLADLKGTLTQFSHEMFGPDTRVRFRPDFFPFVEPGAEWSISCFVCKGEGCPLCKQSGWIELGGAGMIHPNVLDRFGIDTNEWTGFAFGMGIERMPILKYGIDDLRLFLDNDLRFLRQF